MKASKKYLSKRRAWIRAAISRCNHDREKLKNLLGGCKIVESIYAEDGDSKAVRAIKSIDVALVEEALNLCHLDSADSPVTSLASGGR